MLEHHPDFTAHRIYVADIVGQLDVIDNDLAFLVLLQPVYAPYKRRLSRPGGTTDNNALAVADIEVQILEYVEISVPFVHPLNPDDGGALVFLTRNRIQ